MTPAHAFSETAPLVAPARAYAWPAWRLHAALLLIGAVAGLLITLWDLSYRTQCAGVLPCIDYTGVALGVYWAVFGAQAIGSTTMMFFLRRSPRRFFASHVVSAAAVLVLVIGGGLVLFSTLPS